MNKYTELIEKHGSLDEFISAIETETLWFFYKDTVIKEDLFLELLWKLNQILIIKIISMI